MDADDTKPDALDYARPQPSPPHPHPRVLNKWGWAIIFTGCGQAVFSFVGFLLFDGRVSDELSDRLAVMSAALFLLGGAACAAGVCLCAVAASRRG